MAVAELCRKHGVSSPTFYKWKAKFGGIDVSEARKLKALEEENGRLKRLLADAMSDNVALKDLLGKSGEARYASGGCGASAVGPRDERAAGVPGSGRRSDQRSLPATRPRDAVLRERLKAVAAERRRFGYRRLHVLLRREGHIVNRKRVQRLYREEKLTVLRRGGRKRAMGTWRPIEVPLQANQR